MHSTRLFEVLLVALSASSVAQAFIGDAYIVGRNNHEMLRRQGSGDPSASSTPTSSQPVTTTRPTTSNPPSTTSTPPSTSPSPSPSPTPTSSSPTSETPTPTPSPTSSDQTSETPSTTLSPSTSTFWVTTTASDGSPTSVATESVVTPTPSISAGSGNSTSGMSVQTRNTIIGVVVGVGGAIILAVLAFVAWRIWGRKKSQDENDGLVNYGGYSAQEKSDAGGSAGNTASTGRSPFQSTLESYHAPTQVNTASNF